MSHEHNDQSLWGREIRGLPADAFAQHPKPIQDILTSMDQLEQKCDVLRLADEQKELRISMLEADGRLWQKRWDWMMSFKVVLVFIVVTLVGMWNVFKSVYSVFK